MQMTVPRHLLSVEPKQRTSLSSAQDLQRPAPPSCEPSEVSSSLGYASFSTSPPASPPLSPNQEDSAGSNDDCQLTGTTNHSLLPLLFTGRTNHNLRVLLLPGNVIIALSGEWANQVTARDKQVALVLCSAGGDLAAPVDPRGGCGPL
ncbi:unnamed protein product [Arctogadus glacialis]